MNMEVEASKDDEDVMREASVTDFDAGDVVGKLMAFIPQLRSYSEGTQTYLMEISVLNGCVPWHIKLWIRTRWGSLSDCFQTVLAIRKVCVHLLKLCEMILRFIFRVLYAC